MEKGIISNTGNTKIIMAESGITIRCGELKISEELMKNTNIELGNTKNLICSSTKIGDLKTKDN